MRQNGKQLADSVNFAFQAAFFGGKAAVLRLFLGGQTAENTHRRQFLDTRLDECFLLVCGACGRDFLQFLLQTSNFRRFPCGELLLVSFFLCGKCFGLLTQCRAVRAYLLQPLTIGRLHLG